MTTSRPSLKRELLLNLGLLVGAALSLAIGTALLAGFFNPRYEAPALALLVVADVAVVFVFGRHLLERMVLAPMAELNAAAEQVASGDLARRAPAAETRDFTELGERFNAMTERLLDARSQLVRSEKLATVGRFAAGVAHEVGNPLSAIGTYLDVLKLRGADAEILAALSRETSRIDQIVRGLLDYARPGDDKLGVVDPAQVVRTVRGLLERQGSLRDVTLTVTCEDDVPLVRGKAHALEQVLVNLLLNAAEAARGGRVAIGIMPWRYEAPDRPTNRRGDPELAASQRPSPSLAAARRPFRADLRPGTLGMLLFVSDSGAGVAPEDRERVFDPFFTTKPPGQGTGLGLAIVQRTVHESGGVVWVEPAREGGATFKLFLPAAEGPSTTKSPDRPAARGGAEAREKE